MYGSMVQEKLSAFYLTFDLDEYCAFGVTKLPITSNYWSDSDAVSLGNVPNFP